MWTSSAAPGTIAQAVFVRGHIYGTGSLNSVRPLLRLALTVHRPETERGKCEVQRSLQNLWVSVRNWCLVTFLGPGIWSCLLHSSLSLSLSFSLEISCSYAYLAPLTPLLTLGESSLKLRCSEEKLKLGRGEGFMCGSFNDAVSSSVYAAGFLRESKIAKCV